jgi:hypothetical protein
MQAEELMASQAVRDRDWNRQKTVPGFAEILFAVEGH